MRTSFTFALMALTSFVYGQKIALTGMVSSYSGESLINATVHVKNTTNATLTDADGKFKIWVKPGAQTLVFSMVGFQAQEYAVNTQEPNRPINIVLQAANETTLEETLIIGKSTVRTVEETGFNVVAIDAKPYHNATVNLTQVLDRTPGVKIKQEGGLGSQTNVSINGLSGRHVRFFLDGMPMDAMSSSFQLNNIPVNLAERIEVYKGVVPVKFGSDALGGAVNIVTKRNPGFYIDASYSFGSFNTHLTFINTGYTSKKGFTVQLSAYQNYSDNDYYVDAKVADLENNVFYKDPMRVRRFHDAYHNETVIAKIGVVDKKFADQLLFGFTLGQAYDEIQHSAYMNTVYGDKIHTSTIIMPSVLYSKKGFLLPHLDLSLAANYNLGGGHSVDTSSWHYNWLGEREPSNSLGEGEHADYRYKDNNGTVNANVNYALTEKHGITVNNVRNVYAREGDNIVVNDDYMNRYPRVNNRNILGFSFSSDFGKNVSTSVFGKYYSYKASAYIDTINADGVDNYEIIERNDARWGYGFTATYFLTEYMQLKGNYELTCRLPVSEELFGQVFLEAVTNLDLQPEASHNTNFGMNLNKPINTRHFLNVDLNLFYRRTFDYIRRNIDYSQGEQSYENIDLVQTPGVDAEVRYSYANRFNGGINVSYQVPRNYSNNTYYRAIVPNQPNFFGNADLGYSFNDLGLADSRLSLGYNMQFIYQFLNDWDTYGAADRVPTQWSHNVNVVYSWQKGRYNLSADCKNLSDTKLYDNYTLQKPGRSFTLKFRYFFQKF